MGRKTFLRWQVQLVVHVLLSLIELRILVVQILVEGGVKRLGWV